MGPVYTRQLDTINPPLSCPFLPPSLPPSLQSSTTTDGSCTDSFTGTSASAPLMAGVAALVLQAK